jgi:beta-glucosidase
MKASIRPPLRLDLTVALRCIVPVLLAALCAASGASAQTGVSARAKETLRVEGLEFKDLNASGTLDPYEDWRLPTDRRIDDLISRMRLDEKVGMMLINTLNAEAGGRLSDRAVRLIEEEKMTRFIFRNSVVADPVTGSGGGFGGAQVTAYEAAQFMNLVQELAEGTRLGIPVLFKSNARNHYDRDARAGISVAAGSFSEWPKEPGLAATRDTALIGEFARIMRREWTALGLRGMYGYMADLATEPRWYRVHETFGEDAELTSRIVTTLVRNLQGERLGPRSVALTMKHFPGGGPQEGGGDPHYEFGKNQAYPAGLFEEHLRPFRAAIAAGVSAVMPYYGIPVGQRWMPNDVGMAFSRGIVTELLRSVLGFEGYVNSDTGIIGTRAWGLEHLGVDEQIVVAVDAGPDVLSGFDSNEQILGLVRSGEISEARVDESVRRLLKEQFDLGLFENPYVDPDRAAYLVGNRAFQLRAEHAQRKSIVLLQNRDGLLPLRTPTDEQPVHLYTMGMDPEVVGDARWEGYSVVAGDYDGVAGEGRPAVPANTDYAILRVEVSNQGADPELMFGGANPDELDLLAFSDMAVAKSWNISPSLADIQAVMEEVGPERTVLAIYFRQPYALDERSGLRGAGAIVATFGVRDAAIMDVLTGRFAPQGKLPFALAGSAEAIMEQAPDAPGYRAEHTLFPFGHGLTY